MKSSHLFLCAFVFATILPYASPLFSSANVDAQLGEYVVTAKGMLTPEGFFLPVGDGKLEIFNLGCYTITDKGMTTPEGEFVPVVK